MVEHQYKLWHMSICKVKSWRHDIIQNGPPKRRGSYITNIAMIMNYILILSTIITADLRHQSIRGVTCHQHEIIAIQCLEELSHGKSMKVAFHEQRVYYLSQFVLSTTVNCRCTLGCLKLVHLKIVFIY